MFDLTSSKLLILALVALVVVGPKDLPVLLRAIGKYVGLIRRQANEFRAYFDEAMKEQELANLKAEMEAMRRDVHETVASAGRALEQDLAAAKGDVDAVTGEIDRTIHSAGSAGGAEPAPAPPGEAPHATAAAIPDAPGAPPAAAAPPAPASGPAEPALKVGA